MLRRICLLWLLLACLAAPGLAAAEQPVVVVSVKGEIDAGQAALIHRALLEAESQNARALLMEIDTFGGLVDAAVSIRDRISDSPLTTICFVKNRAWSAGALIAISHKHIAIVPGGSIGAAEPIPATEKTIAALKAEFSATAGKTGRDPRVAEAMVDKTLGLPGYAAPGQILALTESQAKATGYADLVAADRTAVLAHFGLDAAPVVEYQQQWPEKLTGFLSNPTVKSLLLSVIFLAVMAEIKTAGMGVAAMIGLAAAALFFGSQWLSGVAGWLEILLFIGGILLIVVELYTPGVGVFGASGVAAVMASLFLTLGGGLAALNILVISMLVAVAVFLVILRRLPDSKLWSRLVLKDSTQSQDGYVSSRDYSDYLGKTGIVTSLLRPAGVVEIEGNWLDVVSEGQFIQPGVRVKVVSVTGNRIVVRPIQADQQ
ncbi:MAG: NfeD family protein [Sporomusaceae bacterium]|nr:NfeD family protein [Sporomusaceae bacterium]